MIDPDQGVNSRNKLTSLAAKCPDSLPFKLLQVVPDVSNPEWTTKLCKLPKITFGTIYDFLVDRKVLLKKVRDLESVTDRRAELLCNPEKETLVYFTMIELSVYQSNTQGHLKRHTDFSKMRTCRK